MAREWARRYWRELLRYLQQEGIQLRARQPRANDRFQAFDIGRRTFFLEACFCERDPVLLVPAITVRLRMSGKDGPAHYHLLKRHCGAISEELGEPPNWREYPPHRNLNLVYVYKANMDVTDEADWPNQHAWLASKLEKFNKVFRPRIMALNAADYDLLETLDDVEIVDTEAADIFGETDDFDDTEDFDDAEDMDSAVDLVKAFKEARALEEQAEYVTPSESNMPMHAYVVMLHLVSQGYSDFTEIRRVLCRESPGSYYITILEHIVRKIEVLEEAWDETIPPITALVFNTDGRASQWTCEILTGDGETQPTAKQVAQLAASVAAYDKWDQVLKALKP